MATYTDNYQLTLPTYAEVADIATINNNMTKIDDIMHASQISMATAYDATRTSENPYNTGDIVMYEKIAYKCKEDGVYGTWDASKWEQTTLADNLGGGDASEISYDNTTSGMTATNVQEAIDELKGNIEAVSDGLDDAVESLAPAFDPTETYDEGDIVSKDNKLYQCNTDNTTGDWDSTKWDEYVVSEHMGEGGSTVTITPETIAEPKQKIADFEIDGASGSLYAPIVEVEGHASGAIASFPDGANNKPLKSLKVAINPVQDLHGYDHPWPAGGGKNKINAPDITLESGGYIYNGAVNIPAGTYTMSLNWTGSGTPSATFAILDGDGNTLVSGGHNFPYTFILTSAATSAKFYVAGAGTYSKIQIEQGSTATTYEPYSNICPISGWSAVNVTRCGKNCFDVNSITVSNITFNTADGEVTRSGFFYYLPQGTYTFKCNSETVYSYIYVNVLNAKGEYVNRYSLSTTSSGGWRTATITIDEGQYLAIYASSAQATLNTEFMLQIEAGSSASDYEPYNGTDYTIQLGDTYYGSNLDATSGVLSVDRVKTILRSTSSMLFPQQGRIWLEPTDIIKPSDVSTVYVMSSHYKTVIQTNVDDNTVCKTQGNKIIRIIDSTNATSLNDYKTYVEAQYNNGTPVEVVYTLATPLTITLTPTQVKSLLGNNNLWSDTGDILECVYQRDLNLVINQFDARITALEQALSGTRSLSLSKSAPTEEVKEEKEEETKEEQR